MCRLLTMWLIDKDTEKVNTWTNKWFQSFIRASEYDHNLKKVSPGQPKDWYNHADGWGIIKAQMNSNNEIMSFNSINSLEPIFKNRAFFNNNPFFNSHGNTLFFSHVRKASQGTPVEYPQVQPMGGGSLKKVFLAHNGAVNIGLINQMLRKPIKDNNLRNYSDSQLLSQLLTERLNDFQGNENFSFEGLWIPLIKEIIDNHNNNEKNFVLQAFLLEIIDKKPKLLVIAAASKNRLKRMPYYQLYLGKNDTSVVVCSSTVYDYYAKNNNIDEWTFNKIEDKDIFIIDNLTVTSQKI